MKRQPSKNTRRMPYRRTRRKRRSAGSKAEYERKTRALTSVWLDVAFQARMTAQLRPAPAADVKRPMSGRVNSKPVNGP